MRTVAGPRLQHHDVRAGLVRLDGREQAAWTTTNHHAADPRGAAAGQCGEARHLYDATNQPSCMSGGHCVGGCEGPFANMAGRF